MRYSTIASVSALALASISTAASAPFGLQIRRSGSAYQFSSVAIVDGLVAVAPSVEQQTSIQGTIEDDGTFKLSDGSFLIIKDDGTLTTGTTGTKGFAISGGYLGISGSSGINVCPNTTNKDLSIKTCDAASPVSLVPLDTAGQVVADFSPAATVSSTISSASAVSSASSTSSAAETKTVVHESTTVATVTSCGPEATGCTVVTKPASSIPPVSSWVGGAQNLNGGFAVAALAAIALV
ncbi:hypothetical protein BABINDRAFT_163183 [Babjeviella inositovora NRRL Y-12698]|uniref:Uncharacterized protein n=1 Tax=Babjeviella inositovora NRRL Y-12698 TaxID=984486 RepID=A0A1E3QJA5_9ASCO|nr:uncharacterized protein BABINDRAFT_163183 [Babjeviella inositovora NRRL Y-12698]ODQ77793.1 hypothetical protein BABINDRAFT_163183 [Babjeviella inositovora NRRL Y-12698]